MSRAYTKEEVRERFMEQIHIRSDYWATLPNKTDKERCDGLAFSILNIIDGTGAVLPALDLSLSPHESNKQFHIDEGENYYEPGMVFNDCYLHDLYYKK